MGTKFKSAEHATLTGMSLAYHAAKAPDRDALITEFGGRTYKQLNQKANQLARYFRSKGLKTGDAVALICINRPEFAEVYAACMRAGLRMTPVNFHFRTKEVAYIIDNCEAKAFVSDQSIGQVAIEASKISKGLTVRLAVGGPLDGFDIYEDSIKDFSDLDIEDAVPGSLMLYTSGTTGMPKGVVRRPVPPKKKDKKGTQEEAEETPAPAPTPAVVAPLSEKNTVVLCTGPLYHAAPLGFNLVWPLFFGNTIVIMNKFDPEKTLSLIQKHKVTHSHMVATMFHRLLALPEKTRKKYALSTLKNILHGAAPTPVHVKQAMMDWVGPIIYEYYASTESGGCNITPEEWLKKPGSVGKPDEGQDMSILDDDGNPVKQGGVGTIYFNSSISGGFDYFKDSGKTASVYRKTLYTLGDQGYFDEDGYLFLTGRSSELIISGGVNIYPAEVDAVLLMHPSVKDAAAVGVPNEEFGEEVKAVVELNPGYVASDGLTAELIAFCKEKLASYKCPKTVDYVETLPRSDAGKVYRKKVREGYWLGHKTT